MSATFDVQSLLGVFFEEAEEHLTSFEQGLLELESNPSDSEVIARIFRAAHSIKGASGTFGLDEITGFTHVLETLMDRLRQGEMSFDAALGRVLLESLDMLKAVVHATRERGPMPEGLAALKETLRGLAGAKASLREPASAPAAPPAPSERRVELRFRPSPRFMSRGMDPLRTVRDLRALGSVETCEPDLTALPAFDELDPTEFYLSFRLVLTTTARDAEILDVIAFFDDLCKLEIVDLTKRDADEAAVAPGEPVQPNPEPGVVAQVASPAAQKVAAVESPTIRVATDKIDKLLDLVGELVIAHAMIVESTRDTIKNTGATRLDDALAAMERHTRELQERVMAIRMVPLSTVFRRFPRVVHDMSLSMGKRVRLEVQGEATEIDKSMVEKLVDPLTHLVRNAIDHGLESPEDRAACGKPDEGTITLSALHQGGNVVIEVADDGRGLDCAKIRAKAERVGLIAPGADVSDEKLHEFIFHAGFSTAASVSSISGRGVGMDVVKRNVELLNGSLSVSTAKGEGTRVRLKLPLTLAILDGLAVRVGSQTFIVPLLSVVESFRPLPSQVRGVFGAPEVIDVRGKSLSIARLHEIFHVPDAEPDPSKALVCIVETNGGNVAVLVDEVLGQLQVVVKSLEVNFRKVEALMGATIMGDGRVAMIVDVQSLGRGPASAFMDKGQQTPSMTMEMA